MDLIDGTSDDITPLSLLLVEDSAADAALFRAKIRSSPRLHSSALVQVATVSEALAALRELRPDCILLDFHLPDADGLSGLQTLRSSAAHAAIVLLTGLDDDATALAAVRAGAQDYVIKDTADANALTRAILHAVQRQRALIQLVEQQNDASHLATHDALTGLANRRFIDNLVASGMSTQYTDGATVILLDLDGFKAINDDRGHLAGDTVLRMVAQRLLAAVREHDVVARLGGDEFLLLVSWLESGHAYAFAERLRRALEEPISLTAATLRISASIGIAHYPSDGNNLEQLLEAADHSMYENKAQRRLTSRL